MWTDDYEIGQPVRVRYQGSWCSAQVITIRSRSCMVLILRGNCQTTTNIHDPRNIQPCQIKTRGSTLSEQQCSDSEEQRLID